MKKLFSYLLISSMVVLSSCTNYDDQFDDLNSQINSLKSQIEGFSSLSSGLSSLQGTVSALQSAVASLPQTATPATDISGLEAAVAELQAALAGAATNAQVAAITADLAATQAALEASIAAASTPATDITGLEASVAALETALAAASTSEEVSAISTELAAAQAALAAAIEANATAAADNATDIAALATSLEELSATIAELQATLASVSTAEEVAALSDALAAAQADLTAIIASSSFYEGNLSITTQDQLDFATSLGDKIKFIQGDLTIDQDSDEDMDAVQLTAVMAKVLNVTGDISYTSTETTTTKGAFTSLTGAGGVKIDQYGDISLPKLATISGVNPGTTNDIELIGSTEGTLVVSLPALKHVEGDMTFTDLDAVTSFSMPVMEAFDGDITIEIDNDGTVDLSAFTNATTLDGTAVKNNAADALTVNAAVLVAPVYAMGEIDADRLVNVDLPMWQFANGSSFQRAETAVLPSVTPELGKTGYAIDADEVFDDATSLHFIAAAGTTSNMTVTYDSSSLETLILGGTYATVSVKGTDVVSITFDGTAKSVTVDSTDIETLDMPYTSAAKGTLVVQNNSKLTSLSADKVNGLAVFTLKDNSDLEDISFDALEESATTGALVTVSGNDLSVESYSEAQTSPSVARKIVSADLSVLSAFVNDAVSKVNAANKTTSIVEVDVDDADIVRYYKADGEEDDVAAGSGEIVSRKYIAVEDNSVPADEKIEEMYISALSGAEAVISVDGEAVSVFANTGLDQYYDIKNWAENSSTEAALTAAGVTITAYGKARPQAEIEFSDVSATITDVTNLVFTLDAGTGAAVSVTSGAASSTQDVANALYAAINGGDAVASKYFTVATGTNKVIFTSAAYGSDREVFNITSNAYQLSSTVEGTVVTFGADSRTVDNLIEGVGAAFVQFTSAPGLTAARSVSLTSGGTATLLTASGVDADKDGDNETFQAATDLVPNTADNSAARALFNVNKMASVSAS